MARQCPDCKVELRTEELLGVRLDVCPECAGIYFDDGEMVKLKESGDDAFAEVDSAVHPDEKYEPSGRDEKRMCPACRTAMQEYVYLYTSSVKLDSCPECHGTWVEHGELEAMQRTLDEESQPINESMMRTLERQAAIAEEISAHHQRMARQRIITRVMRTLTMRRPWPLC